MDLGGMGGITGHVGHALRVPRNRRVGEAAGAAGHLFDRAAGERHTEQLGGAGDAGREVQHAALGRDPRCARDVVPRRR